MLFRKTRTDFPGDADLSPADLEALDEIRRHWGRLLNGVPSYHEIIELALSNMQRDLDSCRRREVVRELEREIAYRQWCAANLRREAIPDKSPESDPRCPRGH